MNPLGLSELNPERLTSLLEQHRQEISADWVSAVRQKWAGQVERLALLDQQLADEEDLFSILRACSGKTEAYYQRLASLINLDLVASQKYSVLEAFEQVVLLKDAILHFLSKSDFSADERARLNFLVHEQMFALVQGLLCGTKEFLSSLVDGGMRGYCQVDERGRVICADRKFQELLNRELNPGEPLDQLFVKNERDPLTKFFSGQAKTPPGPQQLHLEPHQKDPILVGTELCPLVLDGQQRGWYACLVDLSPIQTKEWELYDNLPVGVARVDLKGKFRFANRKFLEILGIENQGWQGRNLWEFLPDKKNREKLKNEIKKRQRGKGNEYVAAFTQKSGRQVPVKIYAVPERDLNNNIIGSLAIIRSLELDQALAKMNKYMCTVDQWQDMLLKVIREVKPFVPYDLCVVSEYSSDQKHLRRLITEPAVEDAMSRIGRWQVPDKMTAWLVEHKKIYFASIKTFLSRPEFAGLEEVPEIKDILQRGYRFFLRFPIIREQPIASLTFLSKTLPYDKSHRALLEALPLDKAVHLALSRHKEEEFNFFFRLIKEISEEKEFREVAKILVEELGGHYGWGNVALFRADKGLNRFLLLEQKNSPGTDPIPGDYEQPLDQGILGYVYRTGEAVNVANVQEDSRFRDVYISPWQQRGAPSPAEVHSELCLPLATENAFFLLNIEDSKINAFSEEEVKALKLFGDQAKAVLERSWLFHAYTAALELTSDAVIWTDRQGRVTSLNPMAAGLLGYTQEDDRQKALEDGIFLKDYFQDKKLAEKAINARYFPPHKVLMLNKAKEPVEVLLSASALPEEDFGGKIFTGKNLQDAYWAEHLEHLEKLYQEIAIQMKTPLSLAFVWLKRLIQKDPQSEDAKTLDKVLKQLRKVDLTFDRLSLYDYDEKQGWTPAHKLLVSPREVLRQVQNDLPESDWQRIDYTLAQPLPNLWGDLFQLTFCVETILAHLLEVMPEGERVQADFSSPDGRLVMKFSGICPEIMDSQLSRSLAAIALGENIINRFMTNHGGEYRKEREGDRMTFRLSLPAFQGGPP